MTMLLTDPQDPRLSVFSSMTDSELRDPKQLIGLARTTGDANVMKGIFIAESRNVIERAIASGCLPFAIVSESRWRKAAEQIAKETSAPTLFVGTHAQVAAITGIERTRGPLAAFYRPEPLDPLALIERSRRVAVLENIANHTNVGAIFRSAAALGIDAILVTPGCHDPFYRRAARVSMGTVFQVPWARIGTSADWANEGIDLLRKKGFTTAALALKENSLRLQDPRIAHADRLALVLGTEGDGLMASTIAACDHTVMIPMARGVDSLNVAAASAVAFWETCARDVSASPPNRALTAPSA